MQNQKPIAAYIIFKDHPTLKDKIHLFEGQNLIGRVSEKASVVIKDAQISSIHAKVRITSSNITITDMGSKNGTFIDLDVRDRIEKEKEYEIHEGQPLAFGEVKFVIERAPQQKKNNAEPKNTKHEQEKRHNIFAEFDQLTEKESKKVKANSKYQEESSIDSNLVDKKNKKGTEKDQKGKKEVQKVQNTEQESEIESSIEVPVKNPKQNDDKKSKISKQKQAKQKEEKQKKQNKQKDLKQKKLKEEKEKKQKEEKLKREQQERKERQREQKERQEQKQREQQKRKQKQEKAELKKKLELENKKKAAESKKENLKKPLKNRNSEDQDDQNKLNPKNIQGRNTKSVSNEKKNKKDSKSKSKQKSEASKATSRNESSSPEKQSSVDKNQNKVKQNKGGKKGMGSKDEKPKNPDKKAIKASLKIEKRPKEKSSSKSKQKSYRSSVSREKVEKISNKAKSRKRVPVENETNQNEQEKGYRLRRRLLKVTKFKISGNPITFMTSPFLKLADDDDEEFDILVMDNFIRTYKLLFAISKGIPAVKKSWLSESEYNKKVSEVDSHWLQYPDDKWLIKESIQKVQSGELIFKGMEFHIASSSENLHIEYRKLERLIYNCGGSVILFSTKMKADKNFSKKVHVLLEKDFNEEEMNRAKSVNRDNIYDVELVLESILMQKIDFKKHKMNF